MSATIIHVRRLTHAGSGWKATETTADCSRFVGHRGAWPTLADALPDLRLMVSMGRDVRLSAMPGELDEAKAELRRRERKEASR